MVLSSPDRETTSPPEITQFDAFLCRELPRKVRKAYEAAMEREAVPMEETLKNKFENIVRGCLENLKRSYFDNILSSASSTDMVTRRVGSAFPAQAFSTNNSGEQIPYQQSNCGIETSPRCYPPPDLTLAHWANDTDVSNEPTFHNEAALSSLALCPPSELLQSSFFDSTWFNPKLTGNTLETTPAFEDIGCDALALNYDPVSSFGYEITESHTGEGNRRGAAAS
jgi:hypothetical protein